MRKFALIMLSGLTLCLGVASARAAIVTVTYKGTVASGSDPVDFFKAGDNFVAPPIKPHTYSTPASAKP